jgi:hypothetical protein
MNIFERRWAALTRREVTTAAGKASRSTVGAGPATAAHSDDVATSGHSNDAATSGEPVKNEKATTSEAEH